MAVLPFGNPTAHIDVQTGEAIGGWHLAWQDAVLKHNGEPIPTDSFLNEEYSCVSALLGCSRSEEHTSELQSLMRISYAVFCLKKKTNKATHTIQNYTKKQECTHTTQTYNHSIIR